MPPASAPTRGTRPSTRTRTVRIGAAVLGLVMVGGLLAGTVVGGDPSSPAPADTTTPTSDAGLDDAPDDPVEPIPLAALVVDGPVGSSLDRYRIEYRIEVSGLARDETWVVRRPYESMVVSTRDGAEVSGAATATEGLWTLLADRAAWLPIQDGAHRAAYDLQPTAALPTLLALGLVEPIEAGPSAGGSGADDGTSPAERTVAGRTCTPWRTGRPVGSGEAAAPTAAEYVEVCIDADGLVLSEVWFADGAELSRTEAIAVDSAPDVAESDFVPGPEVADAEAYADALGSTAAAPATEEEIAALRLAVAAPDGWVLDSVVRRGVGDAVETVRFFRSGHDLIEVAEVRATTTVDLADLGGRPVPELGEGGEGYGTEVWFVPDFRASALRVGIDDQSFLEFRGASPAALVAWYRSSSLAG